MSFPNFATGRHASNCLCGPHASVQELPYQWYDTPNVHHCTLIDFEALCAKLGIRILERVVLRDGSPVAVLPNLLGSLAIYRISEQYARPGA